VFRDLRVDDVQVPFPFMDVGVRKTARLTPAGLEIDAVVDVDHIARPVHAAGKRLASIGRLDGHELNSAGSDLLRYLPETVGHANTKGHTSRHVVVGPCRRALYRKRIGPWLDWSRRGKMVP